jgi:hypothetical protein
MRKLFQVALGATLCIGIAAGLIYSPFSLFWEHEDEPHVYSITWRSAIVLLVLVLLTQWISRLIFRWIGQRSPVEIKKHANRNSVEPSNPIAVCNRGLGGGYHRWIGALVQLGSGFSPPV